MCHLVFQQKQMCFNKNKKKIQKISYLNLSLLQLYTYLRKSYKIVYINIIKNELFSFR